MEGWRLSAVRTGELFFLYKAVLTPADAYFLICNGRICLFDHAQVQERGVPVAQ